MAAAPPRPTFTTAFLANRHRVRIDRTLSFSNQKHQLIVFPSYFNAFIQKTSDLPDARSFSQIRSYQISISQPLCTYGICERLDSMRIANATAAVKLIGRN
jgi:hypothetical protein